MRFIQGEKIFSGKNYITGNKIIVLNEKNNFVEFTSDTEIEKSKIEMHNGILCPGFVNAHCHLELSHLFKKIKPAQGLPAFAFEVVSQRNSFNDEEKIEAMFNADLQMQKNGIVAVGDISNDKSTIEIKRISKIHYHTFVELIGLKPENAQEIFSRGISLQREFLSNSLSSSLAAHAPYSVSPQLMKLIFEQNNKNENSSCIHNQESLEEEKFLSGEKNLFLELYHKLNLDLSWYKAPEKRSVELYENILPDKPLILVHNTFSNNLDLQKLDDRNIFYCFCPNANLYIEKVLPDFSLFENLKDNICIGTDSLASNSELNILSEANVILSNSKEFSIENILQAITLNGAMALGLKSSYGSFIKGKNAGLNSISIQSNQISFQKKLA